MQLTVGRYKGIYVAPKQKVLIMRCDGYDPDRITGIVKEGMTELGVIPTGRILLKPNVVLAHPQIFPNAYTRAEFVDGVLAAVKTRAMNFKEIALGERSGITVPTRYNFANAGYPEIITKHGAKTYYFDESKQVTAELKHGKSLRKTIYVPKPVARTDFFINMPKFKAHPWCRLTLSLKNLIGLQDDRHRLVDHNQFLEHKIADLQEVIRSNFIAVDGIVAGQKMMLTPTPFMLGAIVMGTNSCAVDTVGCHMVNLDPGDVTHLRYASQRGYGPATLDKIAIDGDYPLEAVQQRTKNFKFCVERIDDYFNANRNLSCTVGKFPEAHSLDYCRGGCPGALQEAIHILRSLDPDVGRKMQKVRYVVGRVDGPLNLENDERVIFAGDCTSWQGQIDGKAVSIEPTYKTTAEVNVEKTASNDMLLKTISTIVHAFLKRSYRHIHMRGCPVSVAQHVNYVAFLSKIKNPLFYGRLLFPVVKAYFLMRFFRFMNRFTT
jgi:uncharacterized protein (DUF362 family)